ncbi:hypothetical protein BC567DRAFT_213489 [Phyllosticta citribraziliensis]
MSTDKRALPVYKQRQDGEAKLEVAVKFKDTITDKQCADLFYMLRNCTLQQVVDLWYANVLHPNIHNSVLFKQEVERKADENSVGSPKLNDESVEKDDDEDTTAYNRWWLRTFDPDCILFFVDSLKAKYHPRNNVIFARWLRYRLPNDTWPEWLEDDADSREIEDQTPDVRPESKVIVKQGQILASERPSKRLKQSN